MADLAITTIEGDQRGSRSAAASFFGPGGSVIWAPLVERYFARRGISP
jgi:hypothetical protein